eukprot:sb/3469004/
MTIDISTAQKVYSVSLMCCILNPHLYTALMMAARYYNIKYPLRSSLRKQFLVLITVAGCTQTAIYILQISINTEGSLVWWVPTGLAFNTNPYSSKVSTRPEINIGAAITPLVLPLLFQIGSSVLMGLTIGNIVATGRNAVSSQSGRATSRITKKIFLLNMGSLIATVAMVWYFILASRALAANRAMEVVKIVNSTFYIFVPVIIGAINPVIFLLTRPKKEGRGSVKSIFSRIGTKTSVSPS